MSVPNNFLDPVGEGPNSVYKYICANRAVEILTNLLIRFSQPSVLNDPLEFKPSLKGLGTRAIIEKTVRRMLLRFEPDSMARIKATYPPEEANRIISDFVSEGADLMESQPDKYTKSVKDLYARLDSDFGVLSLSETPVSALMWSHYAGGGSGFLIEFDARQRWFWDKKTLRDSFNHLRRVGYRDRTPEYFLNLPDDTALYTKTLDWSYEKEWRIIRRLNEAAKNVGSDGYGKGILLFMIPPDAIKSVVIGYRSTAVSIKQLKEIVHANAELSHVVFKKAILKDNGAIDVQPVS